MNIELIRNDNYLRTVVDAIPTAIFVVDRNFNIIDLNPAATALFELQSDVSLHRLCGEVLHCKIAIESKNGCGSTELCPECVLRNSIELACEGRKTQKKKYQLEIEQNGKFTKLYFLVSASPFNYDYEQFVLMAIEDMTEFNALQRLLPICSYCKKIRADKQYWQEVEKYLATHTDLNFSHSICPECAHKHFSDLGF